jgi:hypothetical protein
MWVSDRHLRGKRVMLCKAEHLVNSNSTDAAYFRARARKFRSCARAAGDAVIHRELLRLAQAFERLAIDAEIERTASAAGQDE